MADNTTRAMYEALADFSNLRREARQARRELTQLKAAEDAYNASSRRNRQGATQTAQARQRAVTQEVTALRALIGLYGRQARAQTVATTATRAGTQAIQAQNRALATQATRLLAAAAAARSYAQSQQGISRNAGSATSAIQQNSPLNRRANRTVQFTPAAPTMAASVAAAQYAANAQRAQQATTRWGTAVGWLRGQFQELNPAMNQANAGATRLQRQFTRFGNWRPRLTPPFVALVPLIAAVIAAMNPLISLLGSVGTAAFGLASNIASLSGAFLALPGILSAVVAGISSVIASMGGVGSVFKTYAAMKKATATGGSGGESAADRADRLADAEANLARTQRQVQKAQQNLNKAREEALEDLIDLRLEVSRASITEDRAIANLQMARDAYNNVMADPGSQLGDKLDAAADVAEAEAELEDVRRRNVEAQKELNEAEAKGIENSDKVLDAKENLDDAIRSQRDAQKDLNKEYAGGAAAVSAANEYQAALDKLSPSARTFVLALIALEDQWAAMRLGLQERFFSEFVDQIGTLPQIIRNIESFLGPAASSMGRFVDSFLQLISSPEWSEDMVLIGESNGRIIDSMADGTLSLMDAIKDLIVAAAPFTEWLVSSLAIGAENFSDLVETGRQSGDLARWLDKVADRLERWWNIIKNIGATLFNYGAASSEFGDWMSQGFLEKTEGWKQNSEEARREGSKFRTFLEEIQPLLSNVNGMFGDFFGWLSREIMSEENIEDANDLVTLFRDDLGPAIGGLLDALGETDIDEAFVKALASIIDSLTAIIEAGGGAGFQAFFDVLVAFFDGLADLLGGLEPGAVDLLLKILGGLAAMSFIGKFTGLTSAVGWLLALDKAKFSTVLALLTKLGAVGLVAGGAVGTGIWANDALTQVDRANSAVESGDPARAKTALTSGGTIAKGLLGGVGINAGGVTEMIRFFSPETAKEIDNWLTTVSQGLFDWVVDVHIKHAEFKKGLETFWSDIDTMFRDWWAGIRTGWDEFWAGVGERWNTFWGTDVPNSWNTFVATFQPGWDAFWGGIQLGWSLWTDLIEGDWTSLFSTLDTIFAGFQLTMGPSWDAFFGGLRLAFQTFGALLSGDWQTVTDNLGMIWSGIQAKFRDPINWVIGNVFNNGILAFWNNIAKTFGWSQLSPIGYIGGAPAAQSGGGGRGALKYAGGGVLPGDNQGVDNHHFVDQNGMRLDLAGGEGILVPQAARALGGEKGINQLNRDAKRQKLAGGGMFGALNGGTSKSRSKAGAGAGWEVAGDVWDKFINFFKNPVGYITGGIGNLVNGMLGQFAGQSEYNRLISKIPSTAIQNLGNFAGAKAKDAKRKEDMGAMGTEGMGWKPMWAAVKAAFPNANLNDALRPAGTRTAGGSLSYHSLGRAIDVTASSSIFNWIRENYGAKSKELIYSPMGGSQISNGRPYNWGEPVRSMHWDHVHWAMAQGGQLPTKLYDNGGWLPNNGAAINRSGAPEAVFTADESQVMKALLRAPGLMGPDGLRTTGSNVGSLRGTAQQVNDYSVNVGEVHLHNPLPEKPSVSLPKAIRQIGYMQNARQTG